MTPPRLVLSTSITIQHYSYSVRGYVQHVQAILNNICFNCQMTGSSPIFLFVSFSLKVHIQLSVFASVLSNFTVDDLHKSAKVVKILFSLIYICGYSKMFMGLTTFSGYSVFCYIRGTGIRRQTSPR